MGILQKIIGDPNEKIVKSYSSLVEKINSFESELEEKSNEELKNRTLKLKNEVAVAKGDEKKTKEILDKILPSAFALVREAAKRVLGQRHYDVQLVGGIVLHKGQIAEMKTGEGKTLVATLPLFLNALTGEGAHLVTVNDYLSQVGAGWMAPVFYLLGLSTGVIIHDTALIYDPEYIDDSQYDERLKYFRPVTRQEAYKCDVLYGTNNEFGFDYLRDNMAPSLDRIVQRELNFTIVDEVDSILIDEARTPLIISAPAEESTDKYYKFAELVRRLKENEDYNIDEKMRAATLTEGGITRMEKFLGVDNIYTSGGVREVHHIEQALKAMALFKKDKDYVVNEGEVIIVDEFTGRLMHGRRYSEGLHQAIEAKEGVSIQRESQTLATITFQNYFRMYNKLSGMTGTAVTEAEEFSKIYKLETIIIPTNKPMVRKDMNDLIYQSEEGKFKAVINDVKERSEKGQPILIGTISIEKNELLYEMMLREGLKPQVLNAKQHDKEARIICDAGKTGSITIATNMAGRGVDIMLGGNKPNENDKEAYEIWTKENKKVIDLGGLHVVGTERHESRRIDNQLRGRAGRQGDAGSSQFYVSTEDDLMRIFGGDRMKSIMTTLKVPEDMPIENKLISRSIESAQKKVEGHNFDIRKHLVEYDDVINKHRETIYKKRLEVLKSGGVEADKNVSKKVILEMIESEIETVVGFHTAAEYIKEWDLGEIYQVVSTIFPVEEKLKGNLEIYTKENHKLDKAKARTDIIEHLSKLAIENYDRMEKEIEAASLDLREIERSIYVRSIDTLWIEHLEAMSSMRQGIGLRGYGQRDPLIEYKKEAYRMFNELNSLIQKEVVYAIYKIPAAFMSAQTGNFVAPNIADRAQQFNAPSKTMDSRSSSFSNFKQNSANQAGQAKTNKEEAVIDIAKPKLKDASGKKVGRNDTCPCGSGKKYKKCCGA